MNFITYLILLISLSGLNLFIIGLIFLLDLAKVHTEQKLKIIKVGLFSIGIAPIIFFIFKYFSLQTLEIKLFTKPINESLIHTMPIISNANNIDFSLYIFVIYMIGFVTMLFRILFSYLSAKNQLSTSFPAIIQGHTVLLNECIQTPLSFGFPTGEIYFPSDAEQKWTPREIKMSLSHESVHLQQNDSAWKVFSLVIQALLFFVPWSYYLHRRFELEMEIFCDKKTCTETNADISEYGNLLLKMVCATPKNPVFNNITSSILERRILAMKSKSTQRPLLIILISIFLFLTNGVVVAMTSGITENKNIFDITTKILIDGKLISSPRIIARANQFASIFLSNKNGTDDLKMNVIAKNASIWGGKNTIVLNFDVQYKNAGEQMHSKPEFVLAPDQEGIIRMSSSSGHLYEMRVVAKKYS